MNETKIRHLLHLNCKSRESKPINVFTEEEIKYMKIVFFNFYKNIIFDRGAKTIQFGPQEREISTNLFNWCISSAEFKGDVKKGIWLASPQGFGKDVFLKTIVKFFEYFGKYFNEYSFSEFNKQWFDKPNYYFKSPIRINDINEYGYMKRERLSIPFLEFMDCREQANNRRGLLVSSNFTPDILSDKIEYDSPNPRITERAKECFNIIIIEDAESKRVNEEIVI